MKRICSYCQADMGEKCGKCGSLRVTPYNHTFNVAQPGQPYICLDCQYVWIEGSEPVSHGICAPCSQTVNCQL